MSIITISRGSFSKGREVAQRVAERLGYEAVSREVVIEASAEFNVPEIKLAHAIHDAPSVFERFTYGRQRYLAYLAAAILEHFQKDNLVYHGLAGHFFVKNIAHVLKVRIIADFEDRIQTEMNRQGITRSAAIELLKKDDIERREWSRRIYGVDTGDPGLYDLVIHVRKLTVDDAADIICRTVEREQFRTSPASQRALDDLALAARVRAAIVGNYPNCTVSADGGAVLVHISAASTLEQQIVEDITCTAKEQPGVKTVRVHIVPTILFE